MLARAAAMDLPGWYLVAGRLHQTVWNAGTGQPPEAGITDAGALARLLDLAAHLSPLINGIAPGL